MNRRWTSAEFRKSVSDAARKTAIARNKTDEARSAASTRLRELWLHHPGKMRDGGGTWYGRRIDLDGYRFRSQGEVRLYILFKEAGLDFTYEDESFPYEVDGVLHSYTPDFFVRDWNLFVEVKYSTDIDELAAIKLAAVLGSGRSIVVMNRFDIDEFEETIRGDSDSGRALPPA